MLSVVSPGATPPHVAATMLERSRPTARVHGFVVAARHRSQGYGAELLERVEARARERDSEHVAPAVREGNEGAAEFSASEGPREWGTVMEKEL